MTYGLLFIIIATIIVIALILFDHWRNNWESMFDRTEFLPWFNGISSVVLIIYWIYFIVTILTPLWNHKIL